jgi:REP element-mobilizing transposase RayT
VGGRRVSHARRLEHQQRHPVHVTLRAMRGVPSLRSEVIYSRLLPAIERANKEWFRVVHFSVQTNHIHLIVEADERASLSRGVQGLAVRLARATNRAAGRRGKVWGDRFHARALASPRQVRNTIRYVLLNFCKHLGAAPGVDPCSSGRWFGGWKRPPPCASTPPPVRRAETWLGAVGWRRAGGPIDFDEGPRGLRAGGDAPLMAQAQKDGFGSLISGAAATAWPASVPSRAATQGPVILRPCRAFMRRPGVARVCSGWRKRGTPG